MRLFLRGDRKGQIGSQYVENGRHFTQCLVTQEYRDARVEIQEGMKHDDSYRTGQLVQDDSRRNQEEGIEEKGGGSQCPITGTQKFEQRDVWQGRSRADAGNPEPDAAFRGLNTEFILVNDWVNSIITKGMYGSVT